MTTHKTFNPTKTTTTVKKYTIEEIKSAINNIGTPKRSGFYDMDYCIYFEGLEYYLINKKDILQEYDQIIHTSWEVDSTYNLVDDFLYIEADDEYIFNNKGYWNIFSILTKEQINKIIFEIQRAKKELEYRKTYEYRRKVASIYISNPKIRKEVFLKNGKICSKCNSKKKLSLDHIISVAKGGENTIDNLQVLCRKCNSSKGAN